MNQKYPWGLPFGVDNLMEIYILVVEKLMCSLIPGLLQQTQKEIMYIAINLHKYNMLIIWRKIIFTCLKLNSFSIQSRLQLGRIESINAFTHVGVD